MPHPSRRSLLSLLAGSLAAACVPFEKRSPFWGTIAAGFKGTPGPVITRAYTDQLPYASMVAWFKGSPKSLLVLSDIGADQRLTWYSAERQSLTTYGPFVVAATGLEIELHGTEFAGAWHSNPLDLVGQELERVLDIRVEGKRTQVPLRSRFELGEMAAVDILGTRHQLQRVVENVSFKGRHRHDNEYWVEPQTGRTWKSRQIAIPTLPPLNTEVAKYPAAKKGAA